jgi:hypothetical protein
MATGDVEAGRAGQDLMLLWVAEAMVAVAPLVGNPKLFRDHRHPGDPTIEKLARSPLFLTRRVGARIASPLCRSLSQTALKPRPCNCFISPIR